MLPAPIELLESDPMPAHVPATDAEAIEPDGAVGELPPHAAANHVNRTTASAFLTWLPSCAETRRAIYSPSPRGLGLLPTHLFHHRAHGHRGSPRLHVRHHVAHHVLLHFHHAVAHRPALRHHFADDGCGRRHLVHA